MQVGYFNKEKLDQRLQLNNADFPAFTLYETTKGEIVPVTVPGSTHGQTFSSIKEPLIDVGELKERIDRISIQEALAIFGKTADQILQCLKGYKSAKEVREMIALGR